MSHPEAIVVLDYSNRVARLYHYEGGRPAYVSLDEIGNEVGPLQEQGYSIVVRTIGRPEHRLDYPDFIDEPEPTWSQPSVEEQLLELSQAIGKPITDDDIPF